MSQELRVLILGATGMVGQGVLQVCLADPRIAEVRVVGRTSLGISHPKLQEYLHTNLQDLSSLAEVLSDLDACYFCLGVSSAGMGEADYTRITYDLTLAVAGFLAPRNPAMTFVYVSGAGTDATEQGRTLWARVKGRTENALRRLPFKAVHLFRPALIVPPPGVVPKSKVYRAFYALTRPLLPLIGKLVPRYVSKSEQVGRAMVRVAAEGYPEAVLESVDIRRFGD